MKKIKKIAFIFLILVFAAAAVGGLYYILKIKPLKEAKTAYEKAAQAYEEAYSDYEKAVVTYNSKVDRCRQEGEALKEAHKAFDEIFSSDAPYNETFTEEARSVIREQEKLLSKLPEHSVAETKLEFPEGSTAEELAEQTYRLREEEERIRKEAENLKEDTQKLKIPDYSAEIAAVRELKKKILDSVYDPFENLIISFSGTEPDGKVTVQKKSDSGINGRYEFVVEESTKLCNGDVITVTVKPLQSMTPEELNESLISEFGKAISVFEKLYTVDGLSYYLTEASQLTEDAFSKMKAKAEESLASYAEKNWKGCVNIREMQYLGNYFLNRKATKQGFYQDSAVNQLVLIFRVKAEIDLTPEKKDYRKDVEYIYTITYRNLINLSDGTSAADFGKYTEPDESFKVDTGVRQGLFSKYRFTFKGYEDLDAAFSRIVAGQSDHYTYEMELEDS